MFRSDDLQLGVGRTCVHAVEENADLGLPTLQVRAQDRVLVGVDHLFGPVVRTATTDYEVELSGRLDVPDQSPVPRADTR